jgi:ribosome biogenesis GTPase
MFAAVALGSWVVSTPAVTFPELDPYGWNERWASAYDGVATDDSAPGRVLRHDGVAVVVARPDRIAQVALGNLGEPLAVGDWISVELETATHLLPRATLLRRSIGDGGSEQLLAANVDLVAIVAGLDRPVKTGRLERFVALATDAGADPVVVLTKADLVADPAEAAAAVTDAVPGVEVLTLATKQRVGVDDLAERVRGCTVVLVGESGAGKSTLVNALIGDEVAATGSVRASDAKGRHTTTTRNLHLLPTGGVLIDTPGIRSVGLWTDAETVASSFTDVEDLAEECRFRDCAHGSEPGCAVQAAIASGDLDQRRLDAWIAMRREADAAMLRANEHERRKSERRFGRVVKDAQKRKGRDR